MTLTSDLAPDSALFVAGEASLAQAFRDGLRPDEELSLSEWADRYRELPKTSPEPGRWHTDRAPYLREPMDALSPGSEVNEVALQFAAQLGKTEILLNFLGQIAHQAPGPTMLVWPTDKVCKKNSRLRVEPLFDDCEVLRGKLKDKNVRDGGNNRLEKTFPGGVLIICGANSGSDLRSVPCKYVLMDEIDGYPLDVDGEGDPISLVEARTANFHGYKLLKCSTPTFEGTSRIEQEVKKGDCRRYEVPCPHCEHYQFLEWKNLRWEDGKPKTAAYACSHCGTLIEERFKPGMLELGRWVATNPNATPGVRSYLLNRLYAPLGWSSWAQCARKWIESEHDKEKRRAFVNLVLGETWRDGGVVPNWERLWNRQEDYREGTVPRRGLVLTAGVDVQKDRIEVEVVAWGRGLESWSVDYAVLAGLVLEDEVWGELDRLLARQYAHEGGNLPIRMLAIDTGYESNKVYGWVRKHSPHQVVAVNGARTNLPLIVAQPTAVEVTEGGKKRRRGVKVWPIGTGLIKTQVYSFLEQELPGGEGKLPPPGFMHFPKRDEEWFRQLTAEAFRTRSIGGHRRRSHSYWEKTRERNEALDCRVYARAAAAIAGVDRYEERHWREIEDALGLAAAPATPQDGPGTRPEPERRPESAQPAPPSDTPRPSGFLSRWRTR